MQNPRTKYPLILLCWACLFLVGIMILKRSQPQPPSAPSWIDTKLAEKHNDTAIKRLNMNIPSAAMYQNLLRTTGSAPLETAGLIDYYQQITQAMPWMADGYTVLGFCYYRQGDRAQAFDMFQKAFYIDPSLFYNNLNLGLMYLEANRLNEAVKILALALQQDPRRNLQAIASSKIYQDILRENADHDPVAALQTQYAALAQFLEQLQNKPGIIPREPALRVRIL